MAADLSKEDRPAEWRIIERSDVACYRCGLRAGQTVRLRKDLIIRMEGRPTGDVRPAGEQWRVVAGSERDPVVFFLTPSPTAAEGELHTWDDDAAQIAEWFEVVD
jgi:hypothetical protein